jgi:hypothetical protein
MSSAVEICNLGLSHLGAYGILDLEERTKEARECKRLYPIARDAMLESHDWGVVRKRKSMALLEDTYSGFLYAYSWPQDCIMPRKIYDAAEVPGSEPIKFEFGVNDGLNRRIILTDQEDAEIIYTAKVTDANLYTSMMIDALGYRLAAELSIPLRTDSNLRDKMMNVFLRLVSAAQQSSANGEEKKPETISDFQKARS